MTGRPRRRRADLADALHRWFVIMLLTNGAAVLALLTGAALYAAGVRPAALWLLTGRSSGGATTTTRRPALSNRDHDCRKDLGNEGFNDA